MQLRRIGVASAAKLAAFFYAILGLIAGFFMAIISLVSAGFIAGQNPDMPQWFGTLFGVGAIIFFPILYGVMGLVFGAVIAAVYNAVAGVVGGIEVELLESGPAVSSPGR
jgi:hypothetical protein